MRGGLLDPVLITGRAEVEDHPAMDLVARLPLIEAPKLRDQPTDLGADVLGEVALVEDGRIGIGHGDDRDRVQLAPPGDQLAPASAAGDRRG